MTKITIGAMTVEQAAHWLRQAAETTASASRNWDNFEAICVQMLSDVYSSGKTAADQESP